MSTTLASEATVFVVDDDEGVRVSLLALLDSAGLRGMAYPTALEFISCYRPEQPGCLLLDVRMPGLSGLELLKRLGSHTPHLPVIILTGHADVPMAVRAMKHGALDFIQKPFNDQDLLDRVQEAIALDTRYREQTEFARTVRQKLASLTDRERETMDHIVAGQANKVIALELDISERTVEHHRARIMQKMEAGSVAELVRLVTQLHAMPGQD